MINEVSNAINLEWHAGMSGLCSRIELERYVFDDAIQSKYHNAKDTAFCKGVSFGLYLACSMVEVAIRVQFDACYDKYISCPEKEEGGSDND